LTIVQDGWGQPESRVFVRKESWRIQNARDQHGRFWNQWQKPESGIVDAGIGIRDFDGFF
jgi:hypothetical protein